MDRAREPGAARPARRRWGGEHRKGEPLTLSPPRTLGLALLATLFACKINTDPDQAVAIEVILPDSGRVEVTDTFRPRARALNGVGDSVAAEVFWSHFDSTLVVVDSTTGAARAVRLGTGRLQARVGSLRSNPQTVTILAKLDSLRRTGPERDTVALPDSLSDSLTVKAFATLRQDSTGDAAGRRVVYAATTYPAAGSTVTFVPNDTVLTNATGVAVVQVRFVSGTKPDSVVVTATMRRVNGTEIPGSPVTFVVEFP